MDQSDLQTPQNQTLVDETINSSLNIGSDTDETKQTAVEETELTSTVDTPSTDLQIPQAADTTQSSTGPLVSPPVVSIPQNVPSVTPPMYSQMHYQSTPILHDQERAALQQQIQELFCMQQTQEIQDKTKRLQERLNLLQQHETTDQCNGGSQCILQTPLFTMIDSPQVSSTTGRGRARSSNKPRKPRMKKADRLAAQAAAKAAAAQGISTSGDDVIMSDTSQSQTQAAAAPSSTLPVSEDSVTAGTGLTGEETELNTTMDVSQDVVPALDTSTDASGKKIKKPRKPRQSKADRLPREKKRRDDPDKPKKKRGRKIVSGENSLDNSVTQDNQDSTQLSKSSIDENQSLASLMHTQNSSDACPPTKMTETDTEMNEVTDFDDIPGSKIDVKEMSMLKDDGEDLDGSKRSVEESENMESTDPENTQSTPNKKRRPYRKCPEGQDRRRRAFRGRGKGRPPPRGRRGRIQITVDSDQEDDLVTTPPQSPEQMEGEIDSSKRRSARNTARKKYTDDIMLRFSDDESGIVSPSPSRKNKEKKGDTEGEAKNPESEDTERGVTTTEGQGAEEQQLLAEVEKPEELIGKPNYVYINTSDEDNMVVQFVLAQRMGKRELKPESLLPLPSTAVVVKEEKSEIDETSKQETESPTEESGVVKKEEIDEAVEKMETDDKSAETVKEEEEPTEDEQKNEEPSEGEPKNEEPEKEEKSEEIVIEEVLKETSEIAETTKEKIEEASEEKIVEGTEKEAEKEKEAVPDKTEKMEVDDSQSTEESKTVEAETALAPETTETTVEDKKSDLELEAPVDEKGNSETKEGEVPSELDEPLPGSSTDPEKEDEEKREPVFVEVEEFLVKYRNFSYLHCEWRTEEELLKGDKRVSNKIRRFQQKQAHQLCIFDNIEDEPFNPDFVEVDRVLDVSEHTDDEGNTVKHYLVKWKSLSYEDSTWELEEDVDEIKIKQFEVFNKLPPRSEWRSKKRPHPENWKKLDQTPVYNGGNTLRPYQLEGECQTKSYN